MSVYLETERLRLRDVRDGDAELFQALDSDPEVTRYTDDGDPPSLDTLRDVIIPKLASYNVERPGFGLWCAEERATDRFIGWFHLRPERIPPHAIELGFRLERAAWNKGYATEGSRALLAKGFAELGIDRVIGVAMPDNAASIRVLQKLGMTYARAFEENGVSLVEYAVTRAKFSAR